MKRVAVFGLGYVGCVTAACLARDGHQVVGVDVDRTKVSEVNGGTSPIAEPGLDQLVAAHAADGRLRATDNVGEAVAASDIAMIAVGTPSADDGAVDYLTVEAVVRAIGVALRQSPKPYFVVVRSTLLPGILEDVLRPALLSELGPHAAGAVHLCNNPEFLREGAAVKDYYQPPFVLVGVDSGVDPAPILDVYNAVDAERVVTQPRTAALVKYASNAFHAVKVAFANEVGSLAQAFGADGQEVMGLVCKDRKLNVSAAYLKPGFAFGGSCLPKDLRALTRFAEQRGLRTNLLASVLPSNESHLKRALKMIRETGRRKIGMIGLSFKAGTDDLRESPLVDLVETLIGWGSDVKIYDPNVMLGRLRGRNLAYIDRHLPHLAQLLVPQSSVVLAHAQLLILGNDVAEEVDLSDSFQGIVLDLRQCLTRSPANCHESPR
ncbi:MAG: nucleotide sugar dehydrogenase [Planctomycetaceae bacterium]